jgi:branched-chain amino acid transport system permease protein
MRLKRESKKQRPIIRRERLDRGIRARTRDIYALMSYEDIAYVILPRLLPPLALIIFPFIVRDQYWYVVFFLAGYYAIASMSWDLLGGFTGLISFGHALFIGFGGYFTAILNVWYNIPIWLSIPLGTIMGATIGTIIFAPCLRTKGVYFSLVSLVAPLVLVGSILAFAEITGGEEGIYGLENPLGEIHWYYMITAIVLISFLILRKIAYSNFGLVLQAIRDNEPSVKISGINPVKYKVIALFISGLFASLVGSLQAHKLSFVGPSFFYLSISVGIITMSVLGGVATIVGPALGAYILTILTEWLRWLGSLRMLLYGIILLVLLVFKPEGLYRYLEKTYQTFERRYIEK